MKITYRIPGPEVYSYVEVEMEVRGEERPSTYKEIKEMVLEVQKIGDDRG